MTDQKLKVFVVTREADWCEDDAIAVLAVDKFHAERCARCNSNDFRKGKVEVTEIKADKEKAILISNMGSWNFMRVENVKVTFDIPIHFGQPDKNGYVYTKESWEETVKNAVDTPIEIINDDGTRTVVGVAQDVKLIKNGDQDIIKVSGMLFYGGTSEDVKFTKEVITNVTLNGIGITN